MATVAHPSSRILILATVLGPLLSPLSAQTAAGAAPTPEEDRLRSDWASLQKYRDANAALSAPAPGENRVVFMGNSITENWAKYFDGMFHGKPYIGRGISGQTTPQMLVRFRPD